MTSLWCEGLETRALLSGPDWPSPPVGEAPPNDTLDAAADLGALDSGQELRAEAALGDSPAESTDVDWYTFSLATAARVAVHLEGVAAVVGLYNHDPSAYDELYNPTRHRRLQQHESSEGSGLELEQVLAPGTYHLAVSGRGNRDFHPFLAESGMEGATGAYTLTVSASEAALPTSGPDVIASDPAPGASLPRSPFRIRVGMNAPLDHGTVFLNENVQLLRSTTGDFTDGTAELVPLSESRFADPVNELQLAPSAPLGPSWYRVVLRGDASTGFPLRGLEDTPFHGGSDAFFDFRVTGMESDGGSIADDTPAGANELDTLPLETIRRIEGALGDDATDPTPFNPADVDLYHFRVEGPGRYSFVAEVFAGRIGSPLDSALTLFRLAEDGRLVPVASNDNTRNGTLDSLGFGLPLFSDPALFVVLTEGDYYLGVSGEENHPYLHSETPRLPGDEGIYDPTISHSGFRGLNTGPYVLTMALQSEGTAPQVVDVSPAPGEVVTEHPRQLVIEFDRPVNLRLLAFEAMMGRASAQSALTLTGSDGTVYIPRFADYDLAANRAVLTLYDALPTGDYTLRLSGSRGLTDYSGVPLAGNDESGDYVTQFSVSVPTRGSVADPRTWIIGETTAETPFPLGLLFPNEVGAPGVSLVRDAAEANPDGEDHYVLNIPQTRSYFITFEGGELPAGARLVVIDRNGMEIAALPANEPQSFAYYLEAGELRLRVDGLSAEGQAYRIHLELGESPENPTPLVVGSSPLVRLRLVSNGPTTPGVAPRLPDQTIPVGSEPVVGAPTPPLRPLIPTTPVSLPAESPQPTSPVRGATETVANTSPTPMILPTNTLLLQNISPIQGLVVPGEGGLTIGPDRVVLQLTAPGFTEALLQTVIVISSRVDDPEGDVGPGQGVGSAPDGESGEDPRSTIREVLDLFFGSWDAIGRTLGASEDTSTEVEEEGVEEFDEFEERLSRYDSATESTSGSPLALAGALVGLMAFRPARASDRKRLTVLASGGR